MIVGHRRGLQELVAFVQSVNVMLDHDICDTGALSMLKLKVEEYGDTMRHLGEGTHFKALAVRGPFIDVVRKCLNRKGLSQKERPDAEDEMQCEAALFNHLRGFPHPHIPHMVLDRSSESPPSIDVWPVGEMTLETYLEKHCGMTGQGAFPKRAMIEWFGCILSILRHLHETASVLHGDMKTSNFIIHRHTIYLFDYSASRVLSSESNFICEERTACSPQFCAPEGKPSSIWVQLAALLISYRINPPRQEFPIRHLYLWRPLSIHAIFSLRSTPGSAFKIHRWSTRRLAFLKSRQNSMDCRKALTQPTIQRHTGIL
jgi:serine/threonine protein kinase